MKHPSNPAVVPSPVIQSVHSAIVQSRQGRRPPSLTRLFLRNCKPPPRPLPVCETCARLFTCVSVIVCTRVYVGTRVFVFRYPAYSRSVRVCAASGQQLVGGQSRAEKR